MLKTPRTPRRRPGMSSAVTDSGFREAGQFSSIGIGAPSRSDTGLQASSSGVGMPAILKTPRVGSYKDPNTYAQWNSISIEGWGERPTLDRGLSLASPLCTSLWSSTISTSPSRCPGSATKQRHVHGLQDDRSLQGDLSMNPLSQAVGSKAMRNRSGNQCTGGLREMAELAAHKMETITLFEEPFPNVPRCEAILHKVWTDVERDHVQDHLRHVKIDSYVRLYPRSRELEVDTERPL